MWRGRRVWQGDSKTPSAHKHSPFFFVSSSQISDGRFSLWGPDARHLAVVRRAKPGDGVSVGDGEGRIVEGIIDLVTQSRVEAVIVEENTVSRPTPSVTVLQGLARQSKIDFSLQKLSELGVDRMIVFHVSRSVPRWDDAKRVNILRRWERICYEASKQSHRAWLPKVAGPMGVDEAVQVSSEHQMRLIADPAAEKSLREVLPQTTPESLAVVVGPEGGLEEAEIVQFSSAGGVPVDLGGQVLRTETAGIALASVCMFHFGRLG